MRNRPTSFTPESIARRRLYASRRAEAVTRLGAACERCGGTRDLELFRPTTPGIPHVPFVAVARFAHARFVDVLAHWSLRCLTCRLLLGPRRRLSTPEQPVGRLRLPGTPGARGRRAREDGVGGERVVVLPTRADALRMRGPHATLTDRPVSVHHQATAHRILGARCHRCDAHQNDLGSTLELFNPFRHLNHIFFHDLLEVDDATFAREIARWHHYCADCIGAAQEELLRPGHGVVLRWKQGCRCDRCLAAKFLANRRQYERRNSPEARRIGSKHRRKFFPATLSAAEESPREPLHWFADCRVSAVVPTAGRPGEIDITYEHPTRGPLLVHISRLTRDDRAALGLDEDSGPPVVASPNGTH